MKLQRLFLGPGRAGLALLTLCLAGCIEPELDVDSVRSMTVDSCPRWRCGYNSAEINGKSLQELHLGGQANADGVKLVGFTPPLGLLGSWTLEVDGDALVARGGLLGTDELRGAQLLGGILRVRLELGLVVPVVIDGYEEVDSWSAVGQPVPAYALVYADLDDPQLERSVCTGTLVDPLEAAVVVLAEERYDLDAKTVIPDQDDWITLGCAGAAVAKMALLGYGPHGQVDAQGNPASVAQRQATLKMITADYCGDGTSYTQNGTPLEWENASAGVVVDPEATLGDLEAIWTETGAACLETPRIADPEDVACALPDCSSFSLADGEWATWTRIE